MKIGFFGTPEIAVHCLDELLEENEIAFIVAPEDKKSGRNLRYNFCPVKKRALENNTPLLQPASLSDPDFISAVKSYNADIFVVVAYGRIIPEQVYSIPPYKTINLHPSLLPFYRGAAPVQWALINGEKTTGVTVQQINEKMDAGDILLQKEFEIGPDINAGELYALLMPAGVGLLKQSLELLKQGKAVFKKQNESMVTYCGKIDRQTCIACWNLPAVQVHNLVRGLSPEPCVFSTLRGRLIKIRRTSVFRENALKIPGPGELAVHGKKRLIAGTASGIIEILELQPEGKKIMDALSFINGFRVSQGEFFE